MSATNTFVSIWDQCKDHCHLLQLILVHNQFSYPCINPFIRYAWFKSCHADDIPDHFQSPIQFLFEESMQTSHVCNKYRIICCAWCKESSCFDYLFSFVLHYCCVAQDSGGGQRPAVVADGQAGTRRQSQRQSRESGSGSLLLVLVRRLNTD